MTEALVRAIRLISPHLDFIPNETSRSVWESDQNGACCTEYDSLSDTLSALAKPMRVLEVGPGLGPLAGKVWRIGLMGHSSSEENVDRVLAALKELL